jgi:hypothetical protein
MARRSSAFSRDLAELDNLQALPLPSAPEAAEIPDVQPPAPLETPPQLHSVTSSVAGAEAPRESTADDPAEPPPAPKAVKAGTRATQVRLPPQLAAWLGEEAHRTKKTLSTVVALAAREHRDTLLVRREDPDGLDVSRRVASGTVPVTLRLTGAQRQLLDEIAADHAATRSAVVVAALTAVAPPQSSS